MSRRPSPTPEVLATAALRRNEKSSAGVSGPAQLIQEHEQRQMFRRLIDPGIYRPNSKEVAMASLKTLSTIADNILREPVNPKYQQFKPTNDTIKHRLMEPKGALEYAIALGFSQKVKDFQPYYMFNTRKMEDLRMGATILKEAIDLENKKQECLQRNQEEQKAAAAAVAQNVKLAFLDDRKAKLLRDKRERELRVASKAARGSRSSPGASNAPGSLSQDLPSSHSMPGVGHTLAEVENDSTMNLPHYRE
ncbi:hypothetical protein BS17DRAFT_784256 [Gyrodon lividus]|nr:hypothetical protein BS17DRAFT_784256 [Gyrodon lividus]